MLTTDPISQGLEDIDPAEYDDGAEDRAFDRDFYKADFESDRLHDEEEASHDEPSVATASERRAIRREFITDYLRTGCKSSDEVKGFVRLAERTQFGYELINYSPWDGFDFGGGIDDPRY